MLLRLCVWGSVLLGAPSPGGEAEGVGDQNVMQIWSLTMVCGGVCLSLCSLCQWWAVSRYYLQMRSTS